MRAASEQDLYRRLGYCHGHDRALQLLLMRILISGRACELLQDNDEMLELDRFFRRVALARGLEEEAAKLTPGDRGLATAYCAGVNEALAARVPWELRILRYRPEPWTIADSIAISRAMGYVQAAQHQADMERLLLEMVQAGVPRERLGELFPGRLDGLDVELIRQVRLGERLVPDTVRWTAALPLGNTLGLRSVMFAVDDIDATVAGLRARGGELVGEVVQYQDSYRLCYARGPEGIIVALAEKIS